MGIERRKVQGNQEIGCNTSYRGFLTRVGHVFIAMSLGRGRGMNALTDQSMVH